MSRRDPGATPDITVYGPAQAPFVVKVGLALRMKKLEFRVTEPTSAEDFQRWSPETGLLPVIDVDGTRVADSAKILDFLDERFPEPPLLARDPRTARAQRGLEIWTGETYYYYWLRWLRAIFDLPDDFIIGIGHSLQEHAACSSHIPLIVELHAEVE